MQLLVPDKASDKSRKSTLNSEGTIVLYLVEIYPFGGYHTDYKEYLCRRGQTENSKA